MIDTSITKLTNELGFEFKTLSQAHDALGQSLDLREFYLQQANVLVGDWKFMFPSINRNTNPPFYRGRS